MLLRVRAVRTCRCIVLCAPLCMRCVRCALHTVRFPLLFLQLPIIAHSTPNVNTPALCVCTHFAACSVGVKRTACVQRTAVQLHPPAPPHSPTFPHFPHHSRSLLPPTPTTPPCTRYATPFTLATYRIYLPVRVLLSFFMYPYKNLQQLQNLFQLQQQTFSISAHNFLCPYCAHWMRTLRVHAPIRLLR